MRADYDFSPLYRSLIGADHMASLIDSALQGVGAREEGAPLADDTLEFLVVRETEGFRSEELGLSSCRVLQVARDHARDPVVGSLPMADDKNDRGPADRTRVNVNEDYEVQYWSKKFGVSPDQLRAAVKKVGVMAADVEKELARK